MLCTASAASSAAPAASGWRRRGSSAAATGTAVSAASTRSPAGTVSTSSSARPASTAPAASRSGALAETKRPATPVAGRVRGGGRRLGVRGRGGGSRARDGGRARRRLAVAAEDPEHPPDVGERVASRRGDVRQRGPRRGGVAGAQRVRHGIGARGDVAQASRDRALKVAGDAHPLLLRRGAGLAVTVAGEAARALGEALLQERLAAHPPPDDGGEGDGDERERDMARRAHGRVGDDPRDGREDDAGRGAGDTGAALGVAAGRVERDREDDERRDGLAHEEPVEGRLAEQGRDDRGERDQRARAAPGERQRAGDDGDRADGAVVARADGRGQHLREAGGGQEPRGGRVGRGPAAEPREDPVQSAHRPGR